MADEALGRLFAETVEMFSGWEPVFRISGRPVAEAAVSADPVDERIRFRISDSAVSGDVTNPDDVGNRIYHVVSAFREMPHAGWVPVTVHKLVGSEFAFPPSAPAHAAVEGIDGPARLRFEDGSEVSYAVSRISDGEDWLPLGARAERLDARDIQAVHIGVEPLLAVAHQLIVDLPPGDDSAELQALAQSAEAELRNPRPDPVMLERIVARLGAAVAGHADADEISTSLGATFGIDATVATETAHGLLAVVRHQELGDPDPETDREAATRLLEAVSARFEVVEAAISELLSNEPDGVLSERLDRLEQRLSRSSGGGWPRAIGQNLVASAMWLLLFDVLGTGGVALRALVWTLIAIYRVLGYG